MINKKDIIILNYIVGLILSIPSYSSDNDILEDEIIESRSSAIRRTPSETLIYERSTTLSESTFVVPQITREVAKHGVLKHFRVEIIPGTTQKEDEQSTRSYHKTHIAESSNATTHDQSSSGKKRRFFGSKKSSTNNHSTTTMHQHSQVTETENETYSRSVITTQDHSIIVEASYYPYISSPLLPNYTHVLSINSLQRFNLPPINSGQSEGLLSSSINNLSSMRNDSVEENLRGL